MSSLIEFLAERDISGLTAEVFVSKDNPHKFKIKALTREKRFELRRKCETPNKKGGVDFDNAKFQSLVNLECCLFPNFNSEEVIKAFGVNTPTQALGKLLPGEDDELYTQICRLSGFETDDINKDMEEAKN